MKFNNNLQLATFFISIFMLTACGGGGDSTTPNPITTPPPTSQVLTGSWTTQCQASTSQTSYD